MNKLIHYLFLISASIILLTSCGDSQQSDKAEIFDQANMVSNSTAEETTKEEPKLDILDSLICRDTIVAQGIMIRKKNTLDIANIFGFLCQPKIGERVFIVPEDRILEPYDLEITSTVPRDDHNPGEIEWFEVYLQRVGISEFSPIYKYKQDTNRGWEYPGAVAVIYPKVENARSLDKDSLNVNDMPANAKIRDVTIAIDWNNDNKPDAIILEFCCNENDKPNECEYTCGETYIKKENQWVLVYESSPA